MKFLKSPSVVFLSIALGVFAGIFGSPTFISGVAPMGELYLRLIKMTVIPILVTAITSSIAQLINHKDAKFVIKKTVSTFILVLFGSCLFATLLGVFAEVGKSNREEKEILGNIIRASKYSTNTEMFIREENKVSEEEEQNKNRSAFSIFLKFLIPDNIFRSLAENKILELVFFCICFGTAIGLIQTSGVNFLLSLINNAFLTMQRLINWIMTLLPFGLFSLVTKQISETGIETILAMFHFLMMFLFLGFFVIVLNTLVLWKKSGATFGQTARAILEPSIIALSTQSSFACIPSSINALSEKLRFDRLITNLLIPIGTTIGRYGNAMYFAMAGIFIANVYEVDLSLFQFSFYIVATMFASLATAGSTGFATLSMLHIALIPLGVPWEALIVVLYVIDPFVDPIRTLLIVHTNLMTTTLICPKYVGYRKTDKHHSSMNT